MIGVDFLKPLRGILNLQEQTIIHEQSDITYIIPTQKEEEVEPFSVSISEINMEEDMQEDLTREKLWEVLHLNETIEEMRLRKYEELIWRYKHVFNKRFGKIACHKHRLKLKEGMGHRLMSYPPPVHYEAKTDREIKKMIKWNIIKRGKAYSVNPLVITL